MFKVTPEILAANAHISDAEIEKDIADTQCEIDDLRQREKAYEALSTTAPEHEQRLYRFKANAIPRMIQERAEFNEKLIAILNERKP